MDAASPEELETLIEDAVLMRDVEILEELLCAGVVMVDGEVVTGRTAVTRHLLRRGYVAAGDYAMLSVHVALAYGSQRVDVCYRASDARWKLAATLTGQ